MPVGPRWRRRRRLRGDGSAGYCTLYFDDVAHDRADTVKFCCTTLLRVDGVSFYGSVCWPLRLAARKTLAGPGCGAFALRRVVAAFRVRAWLAGARCPLRLLVSFHRCGTLACSTTSCAQGAEKEYDAKKGRTGAAVHCRRRPCGRCVVAVKCRAAASTSATARRLAAPRRDRLAPHGTPASLAQRTRAHGGTQCAARDTVAIVERFGDVPRCLAARS